MGKEPFKQLGNWTSTWRALRSQSLRGSLEEAAKPRNVADARGPLGAKRAQEFRDAPLPFRRHQLARQLSREQRPARVSVGLKPIGEHEPGLAIVRIVADPIDERLVGHGLEEPCQREQQRDAEPGCAVPDTEGPTMSDVLHGAPSPVAAR